MFYIEKCSYYKTEKKAAKAWSRMSDREKADVIISRITAPDARWSTDRDYDDAPGAYFCVSGKFKGWFYSRSKEFSDRNDSNLPDAVYDLVSRDPKVIKAALSRTTFTRR